MPKNKVKTIPVNKKIFLYILQEKKSSIRKLGASEDIDFSEKTIRRALNNGEMRPELVKQIAIHLNIESSLLTGEMVKDAFTSKNQAFREMYLSPLSHIEDFPYFREEQRDLLRIKQDGLIKTGGMAETIKRLLSLFDVSYAQYEAFDFETQYGFEHDLYCAMIPVVRKYFKKNAYGEDDALAFYRIIIDLENYKEYHDELEYADTTLRQYYIENPSKGLSKAQIKSMSSQEILDFDIARQMEDSYDPNYVSPLLKKYEDLPIIEETDTDEDVRRKTQEAKDRATKSKMN